jgi:tRNA nucleotidyltransferase (CCA-adding enzyme)
MDFKVPTQVQEIIDKFKKTNYQLYLVGGALRDLLLKRGAKDWDLTTDASPEEILKILPNGFYNNKFGTVGLDSSLGILEITTMRKEGDYRDHRRPLDVSWTNKIEEDLARRDFTINAIALNLNSSGDLVDPFGGKKDLEEKLIKAVGDPNKRFQEDALRLIRAVRIATQLGFEIESETLEAIKKNAPLINEISYERIKDEFFKLLASNNPYEGVLLLRKSNVLQIILPELEKCFGIIQEGPKHDRVYDIGEHCLNSLKHCPSKDPLVRFATLIHDIGKAKTKAIQEDGNVTFYGHDIEGGRLAFSIAQRFKLSKKETERLTRLIRWHMFSVNENQTDSAIRRFIKNIGLENIDDMMALRVGDRLGGGTEKDISWRMKIFRERIDEVLKKPFSITDLKISGKDVMETLGISPGPKVGEILNRLFEEVLEDSSKNEREYLLSKIKSHI